MITEATATAVAAADAVVVSALSFSSPLSASRSATAAGQSGSSERQLGSRQLGGFPREFARKSEKNRRRKRTLTLPKNGWSAAVDSHPPLPVHAAAAPAVAVRSACIRAERRRSWRRERTTEARLSERSGLATVRTELAKQYCRERTRRRGGCCCRWGGTSKVDVGNDDDNTYMGRGKEEEATFCAST